MSYQILQFNLGTGSAQGYVLQGEGVHEGTNVSLSRQDFDAMMQQAQERARSRADYTPTRESLIKADQRASPQEVSALAELMDRHFLRAHAERNITAPETPFETA